MGKSHIGSGSVTPGAIVAAKSAPIDFTQVGAFESGIEIPANHKIVDIIVDVLEAWSSGTSDALSIGKAGSASLFNTGIDLQADGRATLAFDDAEVAALADVGPQDVGILLTIASVGAPPADGIAQIIVLYATNEDNF